MVSLSNLSVAVARRGPSHRGMATSHMRSHRHGLMLVGPTGGGKSRNLHVLEDTLGQLKVLGEQGFAYEKVKIYQLNPKSITMGPRRGVEVELQR